MPALFVSKVKTMEGNKKRDDLQNRGRKKFTNLSEMLK